MDEFELIDRYFRPLNFATSGVSLGIGDDAAIVDLEADCQLLVTTDTHVEGVHFPVGADPAQIGFRAYSTSVSDIAAMGGLAVWASLALTLPRADEYWLQGFARGSAEALKLSRASLIGGDTTKGPLTVTWHIIGTAPQGSALRRSGAMVDDRIYVSGDLGSAAAAITFELLDKVGLNAFERDLVDRYWRPQPRFALAKALRGIATSCIDISDGLSADLAHIVRSNGCGAVLEYSKIPVSDALAKVAGLEVARDLALKGGDDYELCFTLPAAAESSLMSVASNAQVKLTRVGRIVAGAEIQLLDDAGNSLDRNLAGYRHFK